MNNREETMSNKEEITEIIDKIEQLPSMPEVVAKILRVIENPDVSYRDLVRKLDVGLASKLLQVANSPYYRTSNKINSLEHAISILGLNNIRNILIGINVTQFLQFRSKSATFDYNLFWKHSILTAQFSNTLARLIRYKEMSKIFTTGLIHDIGRLFIAQYLPQKFTEILSLVGTKGIDIYHAEQEVIGITHSEIGGKMAEKWLLSKEMVDVIRFHSTPNKLISHSEEHKIALIVNIAEKMINLTRSTMSEDVFKSSSRIKDTLSQLFDITTSTMSKQKIFAEWLDIAYYNLQQVEKDANEVMNVLL